MLLFAQKESMYEGEVYATKREEALVRPCLVLNRVLNQRKLQDEILVWEKAGDF